MTYSEFIEELQGYAEKEYAEFHRRLTPTKYMILGIRVPIMRKIAKRFKEDIAIQALLSFPNEYYEVVFIKLTVISALPYSQFIEHLESSVDLIDNWAHCDSFKAKCILKHREEFLIHLEKIFNKCGEFHERYVLVTLLNAYVEKKYYPIILQYIKKADTAYYYVHMAVAWLTAEILIKDYDYGVDLLRQNIFNEKTHNKAIQKAIESYRLTNDQKEHLRSLKIKNKNI